MTDARVLSLSDSMIFEKDSTSVMMSDHQLNLEHRLSMF